MKKQAQTDTALPTPNSVREFSVYFAGDLWTHKDLIGNALLSEYILKASRGRYRCVLPQDLEEPINRTVDIRNYDLKHVMTSDMAIFNFDGADLDSGTVVEFIYAKILDIPCVILRTDFRSAGEGNAEQDPWNLMASHWPRTKVLKLHGMSEYQGAKKTTSLAATIKSMYKKISQQIVTSLDEARLESPLMGNASELRALYQWAVSCPGAGYSALFAENEVEQLLTAKSRKGLLSASSERK
jgi:nucleoside 2-deoxyribosyltransferase